MGKTARAGMDSQLVSSAWNEAGWTDWERVAAATVEVAEIAFRAVFESGQRADRCLSQQLRNYGDFGSLDRRFITEAVFALFRWWGWMRGRNWRGLEEQLLISWVLDATEIAPPCRVWARQLGIERSRVVPLGGAPSWPARAEGLRRLLSQACSTDPWRLFPDWLKDHLPAPPGLSTVKMRWVDALQSFQVRPRLWLRAQPRAAWSPQPPQPLARSSPFMQRQGITKKKSGGKGKGHVGSRPGVHTVYRRSLASIPPWCETSADVWRHLEQLGIPVTPHPRLTSAAYVPTSSDVHHLELFQRGELEIQDLASQAVAAVCNPKPGERWWDVCAGAGGKALHLGSLMQSRGVVTATDVQEHALAETTRRVRRAALSNISPRVWDGRKPLGKPGSYHGVLVDAPCSAVGTWRRNPDARWTTSPDLFPRLAEVQSHLLNIASQGVRPGGTLVYSVCTLTHAETRDVVQRFLDDHPQFQLNPFPHPFTGETTNGALLIWPQDGDCDAMFLARFTRTP